MNVGSLFTGIGGFDLGLERAGMRVVWQCESDHFCRRVLAKHWPHVPCFKDVRDLSRATGATTVDVLCGGFPCQDISLAGKGAGIDGARSGLWSEYARLIGEFRPRYVVVENVSALLGRGLDRVLGDLASLGFDAEWDCLPSSAFGAPHQRDRVWIVAYPNSDGHGFAEFEEFDRPEAQSRSGAKTLRRHADGLRHEVAHSEGIGSGESDYQAHSIADGREARSVSLGRSQRGGALHREAWWAAEPDVGRVANGVPARVDRLRGLGNALVPQIAEWIGRRIMSFEASA